MGKVIPISDRTANDAERREAKATAYLMYEVLPIVLPKAGVAERRKLAADILLLCAGKPTRMTPARPLGEERPDGNVRRIDLDDNQE